MNKIYAYLVLTRPINWLLTGAGVFVGGLAAAGTVLPIDPFIFFRLLMGSLAAMLVAAAGYSINDIVDIKIDIINKPDRPLSKGVISKQSAIIFTLILFLMGIFVSIFTFDWLSITIVLLAAYLCVRYSTDLKRVGFVGNLTVAFLTILLFSLGGVIVGKYENLVVPTIFAFLIILSREIVKGIEDVPGDEAQNIKTLPLTIGIKKSLYLVVIMISIAILISPLPALFGIYKGYVYPVFIGLEDLLLISSVYILWKENTDSERIEKAEITKKMMKTSLFFGAIVFVVSIWFPIF